MDEINKQRLIVKAKYYRDSLSPAHIKIIPTGFVDGHFTSELIDDTFFWVKRFEKTEPERVFLVDIFDIKDYDPREEEGKNNEY